jgi:hypothetical protein
MVAGGEGLPHHLFGNIKEETHTINNIISSELVNNQRLCHIGNKYMYYFYRFTNIDLSSYNSSQAIAVSLP